MKVKTIIIGAIALLAAGGVGAASYMAASKPLDVEAVVMRPQSAAYVFKEDGVVRAQSRTVVSFKTQGVVNAAYVRAGESVNQGDLMFELDTADTLSAIARLDAEDTQADAQWAQTRESARGQIAQLRSQLAGSSAADTQYYYAQRIASLESELGGGPSGSMSYYRSLMEKCDAQLALLRGQIARGGTQRQVSEDIWVMEQDVATLRSQYDALMAERNAYAAQEQSYAQQLTAEIEQLRAQMDETDSALSSSEAVASQIRAQIRLLEGSMREDESSAGYRLYLALKEKIAASRADLERQLADAAVRAPVSGVVVEAPVGEGEMALLGQRCAVLIDTGTLSVECDVRTDDAALITTGTPVRLEWERRDGSRSYGGSVESIAAAAVEGQSALGLAEYRVLVKIKPDFPDDGPKEGYGVRVEFTLGEREGCLVVPKTALIKMEGGDGVFVIKDGLLRAVRVTLGMDIERAYVVLDGLNEDDVVVLDGSRKELAEGLSVGAVVGL